MGEPNPNTKTRDRNKTIGERPSQKLSSRPVTSYLSSGLSKSSQDFQFGPQFQLPPLPSERLEKTTKDKEEIKETIQITKEEEKKDKKKDRPTRKSIGRKFSTVRGLRSLLRVTSGEDSKEELEIEVSSSQPIRPPRKYQPSADDIPSLSRSYHTLPGGSNSFFLPDEETQPPLPADDNSGRRRGFSVSTGKMRQENKRMSRDDIAIHKLPLPTEPIKPNLPPPNSSLSSNRSNEEVMRHRRGQSIDEGSVRPTNSTSKSFLLPSRIRPLSPNQAKPPPPTSPFTNKDLSVSSPNLIVKRSTISPEIREKYRSRKIPPIPTANTIVITEEEEKRAQESLAMSENSVSEQTETLDLSQTNHLESPKLPVEGSLQAQEFDTNQQKLQQQYDTTQTTQIETTLQYQENQYYQKDGVEIQSQVNWTQTTQIDYENQTQENWTLQYQSQQFVETQYESIPSSPDTSESAPLYQLEETQEEAEKRARRRNAIVSELITTEVSYLKVLDTVIQRFLNPLRVEIKESPKKYTLEGKPITHEHLSAMFSNIEMIFGFNNQLLEELQSRKATWSETTEIGDIFLRLTPFLKLYTEYSTKFDIGQDLMKRLCKACKSFQEFLDSKRDGEKDLLPPLDALLIAPVQRIPRYNLLLRDLIKHTKQDHVDYESLTAALALMEQVAEHINNSMKTSENFHKLRMINSSFVRGGCPNLVETHRVLIREGAMVEIKDNKKKNCHVFLFNDCIVLGKPLLMNRYSFKHQAPILQTFVIDIADSASLSFAFKIQTPGKTFTVATQKLVDKTDWMRDINDTRDKQMEIEGAKITFKLMKKEEERRLLEKMREAKSGAVSEAQSVGSEMERIMMESKKMQRVTEKEEEIKKKKEEEEQYKKKEPVVSQHVRKGSGSSFDESSELNYQHSISIEVTSFHNEPLMTEQQQQQEEKEGDSFKMDQMKQEIKPNRPSLPKPKLLARPSTLRKRSTESPEERTEITENRKDDISIFEVKSGESEGKRNKLSSEIDEKTKEQIASEGLVVEEEEKERIILSEEIHQSQSETNQTIDKQETL